MISNSTLDKNARRSSGMTLDETVREKFTSVKSDYYTPIDIVQIVAGVIWEDDMLPVSDAMLLILWRGFLLCSPWRSRCQRIVDSGNNHAMHPSSVKAQEDTALLVTQLRMKCHSSHFDIIPCDPRPRFRLTWRESTYLENEHVHSFLYTYYMEVLKAHFSPYIRDCFVILMISISYPALYIL